MKNTLLLCLKLFLFLALALLCNALSSTLIMSLQLLDCHIPTPLIMLLDGLLPLAGGVGLFCFFERVVDRKMEGKQVGKGDGISKTQTIKRNIGEFALGATWGVVCVVAGLGAIIAIEWQNVQFVEAPIRVTFLLSSLGMFLCSGFFEELVFRGYILRQILTQHINQYVAIGISAVVFALAHVANNAFDLLPFINILLVGLWLGLMYLYTGNLWLVSGFHAFFNYAQSTLGFSVSGAGDMPSLFTMDYARGTIINGGDFGFEGSIICTVLIGISLFCAIVYGRKMYKHKI